MHGRRFATVVPALARVGYASEGIVYLVVGIVSALAAVTVGRGSLGAESALAIASLRTAGPGLLLGVGIGLCALAVWELLVAVLDLDRGSAQRGGAARRVSSFVSAVLYGGLGWWSIRASMGQARDSSEQSTDRATAALMEQPFGRWLLGLVALGILAFAVAELMEAWSPGLGERLGSSLSRRARRVSAWIGRLGISARAVVVALIGWFVLQAAWEERPSEARGLEGVLRALEAAQAGPLLLGVVALGLVLYGMWRLLNAAFARVKAR